MAITGRSIQCSVCGASIELSSAALEAPCTSCGHAEPVPEDIVREMGAYEAEYAASLDEANVSLRDAQSMEHTASQVPAGFPLYKVIGFVMLLLTVGGGAFQVMLTSGVCSGGLAVGGIVLVPLLMSFVSLSIPIYLWVRLSGKKAARLRAGVVRVACPTCGADNNLVAGVTGAACAYCKSRLVPSATVVRQVLDASLVTQRQAGLRALRASRALTLRASQARVDPMKFALGSMGLMVFLSVGGFTCGSLAQGDALPAGVATAVLVMFLAAAAGVFLYFLLRFNRREAWATPIEDLARQFGGTYSTKLVDQVSWLDAYWASTYSDYWITGVGLRFGTLSTEVAGYPVLLDVHPEKPYGNTPHTLEFGPRLNILVAAYIPLEAQSRARLSSKAHELFDAIQDMGFAIELSTSGILAVANHDLITRFKLRPQELHSLAPTFGSLARLAECLGPPAPALQ